jgi:hypothetical protein
VQVLQLQEERKAYRLQMKPYHKNPRQITKKQFDQLKENLAYLGDLSGIVHELNTDEIIGGNQRSAVFDINKCQVEIVHNLDHPDEQGTVAQGFVIWQGKRYTYRQVRWTPKQAEQANITANRMGGEWNFDELANWDMSDLLEWGFEERELGIAIDDDTGEAWQGMPEFEHEDLTAFQSLHVHFNNAASVNAFAKLVGQNITDKTKAIWYPKQDKIEYGEAHES